MSRSLKVFTEKRKKLSNYVDLGREVYTYREREQMTEAKLNFRVIKQCRI